MKWYKHFTTKTKTTDKLLDAVGVEGYGRFHLLTETVVGHVESPDDDSGLQLSIKKWAEHLRLKSKNVIPYFECLQNIGLILFQRFNNDLLVQIVNLSNLITKSAISSTKRSTTGRPREEEKERSTISLLKIDSNNDFKGECPITQAAFAAKAR